MLHVFVCEDKEKHRNIITKQITDFIMMEDFDMKFEMAAETPEQIISYIKEKRQSGLYFLDVDLKSKMNGIQLAEKIREYDPRGFIVFITSHTESMGLTFKYKVEAMDYIIKAFNPDISSRILECLTSASKKYACAATELQENLVVRSDGKDICIRYKDILFIETTPGMARKLTVITVNRCVTFSSKLKDIEPLLNKDFYRCHKAVIVNLKMIEGIDEDKHKLILRNDINCDFAVREKKKIISRLTGNKL